MSDARWGVAAPVAIAVLVLAGLLVPGGFGSDEADVDWPAFTARYETQSVSGNGLGTTRFAVDWRSRDDWEIDNLSTGAVKRPTIPHEVPSDWLSPGRYPDPVIATTRGMSRRDLEDGSIVLVQVLEIGCQRDEHAPRLLQCLPGRKTTTEITTTRLGPHRLPVAISGRYDGRLVFAMRMTDVEWAT